MPCGSKSVPFEKKPLPRKGPSGAICIRFALFCALILTGCGVSLNQEASGGISAPSVVRTDPRKSPAAREAAVLADRILRRENDDLLPDARRRRGLIRKIERALARIRDAYPATADISVREAHRPGMLLLGLEPDLFEAVSRLLDDARGSEALRTGYAEFDALNAKLGLRAVRPFPFTGVAAMYFDERVNIDAARKAYRDDGRRPVRGARCTVGRWFRYRSLQVERDLACRRPKSLGRLPGRLPVRGYVLLHGRKRWGRTD